MGGCFVHERHSRVDIPAIDSNHNHDTNGTAAVATESSSSSSSSRKVKPPIEPPNYLSRLSGWWGSSKATRFAMDNNFTPLAGAAGWQISNTSAADATALRATLDVFKQTDIHALRAKSLKLTKYLEDMLDALSAEQAGGDDDDDDDNDKNINGLQSEGERRRSRKGKGCCFRIITPRNPEQRGVQLSLLLDEGLLDSVMETFEACGVVLDERRPNVIRVAPAPLYNNFCDVWEFVQVFRRACKTALAAKGGGEEGGGGRSE